jgi:hypothetical protein
LVRAHAEVLVLASYISKAERAAKLVFAWTQLIDFVQRAAQCDESEARRQIANAIHDRQLHPKWTKEKSDPMTAFGWGGIGLVERPLPLPRSVEFWFHASQHRSDPDKIRAPQSWVRRGDAARPQRSYGYKKPIFDPEQARHCWRSAPTMMTPASQTTEESRFEMPNLRNLGGRPRKYDWDAFAAEMMRIANTPDGLPDRHTLTEQMKNWCTENFAEEPADSAIRDRISKLYPAK